MVQKSGLQFNTAKGCTLITVNLFAVDHVFVCSQ